MTSREWRTVADDQRDVGLNKFEYQLCALLRGRCVDGMPFQTRDGGNAICFVIVQCALIYLSKGPDEACRFVDLARGCHVSQHHRL